MSKYTTGEIAKLCGVSVRTVQYYDSRNILVPSELSEGGNPESKGISSYSVDGRKFPHLRNGGGTVICYGNLHHRSFECGLFGNQLSCL